MAAINGNEIVLLRFAAGDDDGARFVCFLVSGARFALIFVLIRHGIHLQLLICGKNSSGRSCKSVQICYRNKLMHSSRMCYA